MKITIKVKNNPTASDLRRFQAFSDKYWGEHYDTEEEIRENFFDKPKIVILAYIQNNLVGLLNLHLRNITFEKQLISMGGIGGVVTHTKYRHKGIATNLLAKSIEVLKKENTDIAILCTDIERLGLLYKNAGFVPLKRPYYFLTKHGKRLTEDSGMIAPVKSTEIFKKILNSKAALNIGPSNI